MLEKNLQQKIIHAAKELGVLAVKVDSTSRRGWPDLTCVLPNGVVVFVEVKTKTGRLSKLQAKTISEINSQGGYAHVVRSVEQFTSLIGKYD